MWAEARHRKKFYDLIPVHKPIPFYHVMRCDCVSYFAVIEGYTTEEVYFLVMGAIVMTWGLR